MLARGAVSVILPTRDRLASLKHAVYSVLRQHDVDLELIVVDDASTDETITWLATVDDPRVRVLRQPSPAGAAAARNRGIDASVGDYLAFIDSDDAWLPGKLRSQILSIDQAGGASAPLVHSARFRVKARRGYVVGGASRAGPQRLQRLFSAREGEWISSCLVLTRAALDLGVSFDPALRAMEDQDVAVQVASRGGQVVASAEILVVKGTRGCDNLSSAGNLALGHVQFIEKYRSNGEWSSRSTYEHAVAAAWGYSLAGAPRDCQHVLRTYLPGLPDRLTCSEAWLRVMRGTTFVLHPAALATGLRRLAVR